MLHDERAGNFTLTARAVSALHNRVDGANKENALLSASTITLSQPI